MCAHTATSVLKCTKGAGATVALHVHCTVQTKLDTARVLTPQSKEHLKKTKHTYIRISNGDGPTIGSYSHPSG